MSITVGQIPVALQSISQMDSTLNDLRMLLSQAQQLAANSWQIDIGARGPIIMTVSPAQQAAMIALYDSFKATLVTAYGQLP